MERLRTNKLVLFFGFLAGITTGALVSFMILTTIVSARLDFYVRTNDYQESVIEEKNIRLEQLEKSINKGNYILKAVEVVLITEDDAEMDTLSIEKEIKKKYNQLLGREVKTLDAEMIAEVVDKRIFRLDEKEYQLAITKLILAETLKLWIRVELID